MYNATSAATQPPSSRHPFSPRLENAHIFPDSVLYNSSRNDPMGDGTANSFDFKGKGRATPKNDELSLDLNAVEGGSANGHGDGAFMQMQLVEQQVCFSPRDVSVLTVFLATGYIHSTTLDRY